MGWRFMYYLTGLPGWMRGGFGPGWFWTNPWWLGYGYGFPAFSPYPFGGWFPAYQWYYPWYGPQLWW